MTGLGLSIFTLADHKPAQLLVINAIRNMGLTELNIVISEATMPSAPPAYTTTTQPVSTQQIEMTTVPQTGEHQAVFLFVM